MIVNCFFFCLEVPPAVLQSTPRGTRSPHLRTTVVEHCETGSLTPPPPPPAPPPGPPPAPRLFSRPLMLCSTALSRPSFRLARSNISRSYEFLVIRRYTFTALFCPMRWQRAWAWEEKRSGLGGDYQGWLSGLRRSCLAQGYRLNLDFT